jgi:hypothetical protein
MKILYLTSKTFFMKSIFILLIAIISISSCSQSSSSSAGTGTDTATTKKEVAQAEENMFNAIKNNDADFWNTVSDSYTTINADGVMANKQETIKDSVRRKMFTGIDHKLFDHTIKVFGDVGICNGRAQFFMQNQMVAEVYYTAIFRKQNGTWLYENWQGTMTKNNPKQPG